MRRTLLVGLVGLLCSLLATPPVGAAEAGKRPQRPRVLVTVEGRELWVRPKRVSALEALKRAGVTIRDGRLLSAVTQTVLDPLHDHGYVLVNGRPASVDTRLRRGWRVEVHHGVDVVEPTATREVVLPYENQDKVGQPGWLPGQEGLAEEVYGVLSGEVVEHRVVRAPVAAVEVRVQQVRAGASVYLTFDDGPDPTWTPAVLDVLARHGVKATFCMVGRYARVHPGLARRVVAEGHAVCNHTQSHAALDSLSADGVEAEIAGGQASIAAATGASPSVLRFPYGRSSPQALAVASRLGLSILGWTVDPSDYTRPGVDQLVARVAPAVRPGAIVLFHDGGGDRSQTVAAIDRLIPMLKEAGYSFGRP